MTYEARQAELVTFFRGHQRDHKRPMVFDGTDVPMRGLLLSLKKLVMEAELIESSRNGTQIDLTHSEALVHLSRFSMLLDDKKAQEYIDTIRRAMDAHGEIITELISAEKSDSTFVMVASMLSPDVPSSSGRFTTDEIVNLFAESMAKVQDELSGSTEATMQANELYGPLVQLRLAELQQAGLPLPDHWLETDNHYLEDIPIVINPILQYGSSGQYFARASALMLAQSLDGDPTDGYESSEHVYVHELLHYISGSTFTIDDETGEPLITNVGFWQTALYHAGDNELNEATTEALARWVVSSETPDFTTMTCRDFFYGPADVAFTFYADEQLYCAVALAEMPVSTLLNAYFEDRAHINNIYSENRHMAEFDQALSETVRGGWYGLEKIFSSLHARNQIVTQTIPNAYRHPIKHARTMEAINEENRDLGAIVERHTREWQVEVAQAKERADALDKTIEISNPHTMIPHITVLEKFDRIPPTDPSTCTPGLTIPTEMHQSNVVRLEKYPDYGR